MRADERSRHQLDGTLEEVLGPEEAGTRLLATFEAGLNAQTRTSYSRSVGSS